jgi:hypothetical protein
MSFVMAVPEVLRTAATDLATIGSNVDAAHMVAATRTTSVIPAAADEVSTGIAQLFSQHAASYQALAGQAAAFHGQFVTNLAAGAFSYTDIEAALTAFLSNPLGPQSTNTTLVLAALELPILIPFLIVTAPVWIPAAIIIVPFVGVLAAA